MNKSTMRKSAVTSTAKGLETWSPLGVRWTAWRAVLTLATLHAVAVAQPPCPGIHVKILDIRNSTGTVACALFESPVGFPIEFLRSATDASALRL